MDPSQHGATLDVALVAQETAERREGSAEHFGESSSLWAGQGLNPEHPKTLRADTISQNTDLAISGLRQIIYAYIVRRKIRAPPQPQLRRRGQNYMCSLWEDTQIIVCIICELMLTIIPSF